MKIRKQVIEKYIKCGEKWHKYLYNLSADNVDEYEHTLWEVYYADMQKELGYYVGSILYFLIEYARINDLTADNIAKAFRAMNIEVEE